MARLVIEHQGTSPGIAIGRAHLIAPSITEIPQYRIATRDHRVEIDRFQRALTQSQDQLHRVRKKLCGFRKNEQGEILATHLLLLQDALLVNETINTIRQQNINAEWALSKVLETLTSTLGDASDSYLRQRRDDIEHVVRRLLWNLLGLPYLMGEHIPYPATIVVALDLSPAEVAALPRRQVKGIISAQGGPTSHTAIIARSLEFPAILGVEGVFAHVQEGTQVILDGDEGKIIVEPNDKDFHQYRGLRLRRAREEQKLLVERDLPATTTDGYRIRLGTNIELIDEVELALEHGAEEIGMYRTEYLFLNRTQLPEEEEQYGHYTKVLKEMGKRPATIRTLDIGGDKMISLSGYHEHRNPALGLRAIRFCLKERGLFHTQLRALYRASIHGQLRILFPLVSAMEELRLTQQAIAEVQQELTAEGHPFDPSVPLGIMIEVPAAVMIAEQLAAQVQFFSIGTNDLIQYTLAIDRTDDQVAYLYQPLHPAVLRMIHRTVAAAKRAHIEVSCCGEMAGDPMTILPLIGLEVAMLSMNSVSIPRVKHLIRSLSFQDAKTLVASALQASTAADVEEMVKNLLNVV